MLLPLANPKEELTDGLKKGPMAITPEQMWELLGFNGPAVQVQDAEGRPIAIGLEDLLAGLEKHWKENKDDLNRGRLYAQELMKYERVERAEKVLAKIVASGGTGEDWLGLGVTQLQQEKWDKAESTLKGAQNLLKENPFPALHLAKVYKGKGDTAKERELIEQAISIDANCVDAWAYLFSATRENEDDAAAVKAARGAGCGRAKQAKRGPLYRRTGLLCRRGRDTRRSGEMGKESRRAQLGRPPRPHLSFGSLRATRRLEVGDVTASAARGENDA